MAEVECKACGEKCSEEETSCPACGATGRAFTDSVDTIDPKKGGKKTTSPSVPGVFADLD